MPIHLLAFTSLKHASTKRTMESNTKPETAREAVMLCEIGSPAITCENGQAGGLWRTLPLISEQPAPSTGIPRHWFCCWCCRWFQVSKRGEDMGEANDVQSAFWKKNHRIQHLPSFRVTRNSIKAWVGNEFNTRENRPKPIHGLSERAQL